MEFDGNEYNKEHFGRISIPEDLKGLPRDCPECGITAHHEIKGRKPVEIECPNCDHMFTVQKYKRGERPKGI